MMTTLLAGVAILWQQTFWVIAMVLSVPASAIFSGLETGTYVLNKARLELLASRNDPRARRLAHFVARPQELLSVLMVSNNAANFLATSASVALFTLAGSERTELYTTLIITPVLFVLAEMVPKNLFQSASETLTYRLSWILAGAAGICRWTGLTFLVASFSRGMLWLYNRRASEVAQPLAPRQRVSSILAEGYAHGVLTQFQSAIADRVMQIASTTVRQVMVDLSRVVSIPVDCPRDHFVQTVRGSNYSRLPVWRDKPANIVGIVNIYEVLCDPSPQASPAQHMFEPIRLSASLDVAQALVALQRAHRSLGVVVDGAGRAMGIVTIKDLVEEIIGELEVW